MIVAFIDDQRAQGHAVESVCRVLSEQGCQIAARTYRSWKQATRDARVAARAISPRTHSDAQVTNAVRDLAWAPGPRRAAG